MNGFTHKEKTFTHDQTLRPPEQPSAWERRFPLAACVCARVCVLVNDGRLEAAGK